MKLKLDFSLSKLVRLRVGVKLGRDAGAALDVRLRLRGREPLRWKAALGPSSSSSSRAGAGAGARDERGRELASPDAPTFDDDPLLPRN